MKFIVCMTSINKAHMQSRDSCLHFCARLQFVEGIQRAFEEFFKKNSNLKEGDIDTITKGLIQAEET